MLKQKLRHSTLAIAGRAGEMVRQLRADEAASGKFILAAVAIALLFTNSPWAHHFNDFWQQTFSIRIGSIGITETLQHWIDQFLMAIFFLVAGLEIKREIVRGGLQTWREASVPIAASVGGMVLPILLFMAFNHGYAGFDGWAIPMTTDTAIAIGMLALLGRRIPAAMSLFLLTVVVIDDIGAVLVISFFYNNSIHVIPLLIAGGILALIGILQWLRLLRFSIFIVLGIGLWLAFHASGVHAAIAGALLGLSAPIVSRRRERRGIAGRLEHALIPVSAFIVMPLFALANAGVAFSWNVFQDADATRLGLGIVAGLVLGKALGIVGGTYLVVKATSASLPPDVSWRSLTGVGVLAGLGFTLSIFIAELAFASHELVDAAKMSIFAASIISAVTGLLILARVHRHYRRDEDESVPTPLANSEPTL